MTIQQDYTAAVERFRQQKDGFFRAAPESPIPLERRQEFPGLRYFPPEFDLRLEAQVERLPAGDFIEIATTDGDQRRFERFARLRFTVAGTACSLIGYRAESEDQFAEPIALFVPFRDATTTKETYGAGRYLDVEIDQDDQGREIVPLDFNLAYNPYCAYNEYYSCPITPLENTLPVAIYAGERV